MTEREAFLAAIKAHPDDDTVRLVFADWLDEHGEPARAEFIREHIAAERHADEWECWYGARTLAYKISGKRQYAWLLPPGCRVDGAVVSHPSGIRFNGEWDRRGVHRTGDRWCACEIRRGFVDVLEISLPRLLGGAEPFLAEHPVRTVKLTSGGLRVGVPEDRAERLAARWPDITFEPPLVVSWDAIHGAPPGTGSGG